MPNAKRINQIIERLRQDQAIGTHFRMSDYAKAIKGDDHHIYQECNTAFCMAGWANFFRLKEEAPAKLNSRLYYIANVTADNLACEWLEIDGEQACKLFYMRDDCYPTISMELFDLLPAEQRYPAGIRVLEILRDEGHTDWRRAIKEAGIDIATIRGL